MINTTEIDKLIGEVGEELRQARENVARIEAYYAALRVRRAKLVLESRGITWINTRVVHDGAEYIFKGYSTGGDITLQSVTPAGNKSTSIYNYPIGIVDRIRKPS